MLQVAVHRLRELHQAKNTALLLQQTNGGKDLRYNDYVQQLSYAASDYDNGHVPAETQEDDFDNYEDNLPDSEPFNIDTPVETIQAYAANYRPNLNRASNDTRVWMPKERWLSLDDKTESIWDSIDDKYNNINLGTHHLHPLFPLVAVTPPKSPTKPPFKSRKAFLHNILQAYGDDGKEAQEYTAEELLTSADLEPDPP
jgi:hypothetical protein